MRLRNLLRLTPRRSVIFAALAYAFIPLTVEFTASDTNPFYFNSIAKAAQVPVIVIALLSLYRYYFQKGELSIKKLLTSSQTYLITYDDSTRSSQTLLRYILKMPIFWLALSYFDYALFTWSTQYVETVISAVIFELWPLVFVATLIYTQRANKSNDSTDFNKRKMRAHDWVLMSLAPLGLFLVFISQAEDLDALFETNLSDSIIGTMLAFSAALLSGIAPSMTIIYGEQLYLKHQQSMQTTPTGDSVSSTSPFIDQERSDKELWFTLFGFAVAILFSAFYNFGVGLFTRVDSPTVTLESFYGAIILGAILLAPGSVLLRKANHDSHNANLNGILFFAPVLALSLLFATGSGIARLDIFVIGAALILVINILIQANPDRQSDVTVFGEKPTHGNRMGFTAMILALWFFGAAIYLRDKILPSGWVTWQGPDYWNVVALSATIFALIFGFRVARLANRRNNEDGAMLELFRRFENILLYPDQRILDPSIIRHLQDLDRASPTRRIFQDLSTHFRPISSSKGVGHEVSAGQSASHSELDFQGELFQSYMTIRRHLQEAKERCMSLEESTQKPPNVLQELNILERQLDVVTHSKQQGRDFSELISLMIFAAITVFLAIGARPSSVQFPTAGWSGFLTELFSMLFVSTIVFLAVNLLDIRRDREVPLIVGLDQRLGFEKEHILFFRLRRDLTGQRIVAVVVTLGLCALYSVLLYDKWLS